MSSRCNGSRSRRNKDESRGDEKPDGFPCLPYSCNPRKDNAKMNLHEEEMKAQVGSLVSQINVNKKRLDTKIDTNQRKMDGRMSIRLKKMEA
jgi:hypothetical protein